MFDATSNLIVYAERNKSRFVLTPQRENKIKFKGPVQQNAPLGHRQIGFRQLSRNDAARLSPR